LIDNCTGVYLDPSVVGTSTNDEGGISPIFSDSNDHVEIDPCSDFRYDPEGTVSLWVKTPENPSYSAKGLLGMRTEYSGAAALSLVIIDTAISVYLDDDEAYSAYGHAAAPIGSIERGVWSHVAFSWGARGLYVYVNGDLVASNTYNQDSLFTYSGRWAPTLHIGRGILVIPSTTSEIGFDGSIAHVAFLQNQMDDADIKDLAAVKPDLNEFSVVDGTWTKVFY
ncbi:MAG: hypothetical protein JJ974_12545, partial [Phycisphaerales bacterium]|nr:hypothetical protein [Phycisphaerales bacterium]